MKLTIEENREAIKRYRHIKPAPHLGVGRCSAACPGTPRACTLKRGHSGPHIAHGAFNRVLAVWDKGLKVEKAVRGGKRPREALARRDVPGGGVPALLKAMRDHIRRRGFPIETAVLLVLAVSMVWFAIDWALRIIGWK